MPVWSHSKIDENGNRYGSKLLTEHLKGVREKALANKFYNLNFKVVEQIDEILEALSCLHDLGKFTSYFQTYLLSPDEADYELKQHSGLGAFAAFNLFEKKSEELALLIWYLIKMHHSNLRNIDLVIEPANYTESYELEKFEAQCRSILNRKEFYSLFKSADELLRFRSADELYSVFKKCFKRNSRIERFFLVNYLFSLLIEADKLDASDSAIYIRKNINADLVNKRFGHPEFPSVPLHHMTQNNLRNYVRHQVVSHLQDPEILNKRIFTLAAPTGIGKTMTALDFMLGLRAKIKDKESYLPQIIYGLPFINIIEQALSEYEKTIGDSAKIMGHYQFADIFGRDKDIKGNIIDDEIKNYNQRQMEWDTWQGDIVITSFVQFFETLIGYRNKLLKKFHHLAGSLIILDEVQTLPIEKLPLIGAAISYLCKFLNARVLIMTATQPKLFQLMHRELDIETIEKRLQPIPLLQNADEVFACFNRTSIIPIEIDANSNEPTMDDEKFISVFKEKWNSMKSCLIVVNKVKRSIDIYNLICNLKNKDDFDNPILYLSTNITPRERRRRINWMKYKMKYKTKPILISTQVVEAGVDLDFDMGFRDLGPIDSIVQVAGRINRENEDARKGAPLYVVNFGDCRQIYGSSTDSKARQALSGIERIEEKDYKKVVETYFSQISENTLTDFRESREIFRAMSELRYDKPNKSNNERKTVSDFRIIENSYLGVSIFVEQPGDKIGTKARIAFQELHKDKIKKQLFDHLYKQAFNQRIIAVPSYIHNVFELEKEEKLSDNILWIKPDNALLFYDKITGFNRDKEPVHKAVIY